MFCDYEYIHIIYRVAQHYEEKGLLKDKIRTEKIENRELTVIRIPNNDVNQNFSGVCEYIDLVVKDNLINQ